MTREEQKYRVTARHQLIDLNKDNTNFKLRFECYADPSAEYQVCVTNQDELDTKDMTSLPLKNVVGGTISGNIVADSNAYQNYFLVLRADKECEVMVVVDLEPMAFVEPPPQEETTTGHDNGASTGSSQEQPQLMWKRLMMYLGIAVLLFIIAGYIFSLGNYSSGMEGGNVVVTGPSSIIDDINSL